MNFFDPLPGGWGGVHLLYSFSKSSKSVCKIPRSFERSTPSKFSTARFFYSYKQWKSFERDLLSSDSIASFSAIYLCSLGFCTSSSSYVLNLPCENKIQRCSKSIYTRRRDTHLCFQLHFVSSFIQLKTNNISSYDIQNLVKFSLSNLSSYGGDFNQCTNFVACICTASISFKRLTKCGFQTALQYCIQMRMH